MVLRVYLFGLVVLTGCGSAVSSEGIPSPSLMAVAECPSHEGVATGQEPTPASYEMPVATWEPMEVDGSWEGKFAAQDGSVHPLVLEVLPGEAYTIPMTNGGSEWWVKRDVRGTVEGWFDVEGFFGICLGPGGRPCVTGTHYGPIPGGGVIMDFWAADPDCVADSLLELWVDGAVEDQTGQRIQGQAHLGAGCLHLLPAGEPWLMGTIDLYRVEEGE